ncbi:peptidase A4 family-domain-containing protein [Biscogniauxia mediterranea]|nr:peptidase A4 family-domain-containing protein [Biscogniauxia mediterranea]
MPPLALALLTWVLYLAPVTTLSLDNSNNNYNASPPPFFTSSATSSSLKRTCSFLGGAVMTIPQQQANRDASVPALSSVTAEWNVAWLRPDAGVDYGVPDNRHGLGQWVGVLGTGCARPDWYPFLQAGTAVSMDEHGESFAYAWVEWFPAASQDISKENMTVSPGDQMRVTVEVYSQTTGYVNLTNLSTNRSYAAAVSAPDAADPAQQICLGDGNAQVLAEWAIKDDRARPLVFNNVTFSRVSAVATTAGQGGTTTTYDFGSAEDTDLWDMSAGDAHYALPERVDNTTLRVYSPKGKDWDPLAAAGS